MALKGILSGEIWYDRIYCVYCKLTLVRSEAESRWEMSVCNDEKKKPDHNSRWCVLGSIPFSAAPTIGTVLLDRISELEDELEPEEEEE